jgi:hypothetical protein
MHLAPKAIQDLMGQIHGAQGCVARQQLDYNCMTSSLNLRASRPGFFGIGRRAPPAQANCA